MKKLIVLLFCSMLMLPVSGFAGENYLSGNIDNISSTSAGLLIMLDTGVPTNCTGTLDGWMLINQSSTTMISTVLMLWATKRLNVTVYTDDYTGAPNAGICTVNQVDPAG